ncbi:MAG TPA: hypothetical protein VGQ86_03365 [Candidatus Limnocylindria bacterium]|nr:hypothetical protein [Candidatus Limnocylindria bacterium]
MSLPEGPDPPTVPERRRAAVEPQTRPVGELDPADPVPRLGLREDRADRVGGVAFEGVALALVRRGLVGVPAVATRAWEGRNQDTPAAGARPSGMSFSREVVAWYRVNRDGGLQSFARETHRASSTFTRETRRGSASVARFVSQDASIS